uniref:Pyrroline-5-carboxylate reductase 3 n=1 Tax=Nothobranchius furzeri TaxID=105023 RepID=A0A8C6NR69_NOTFU
MRCKGASYQLSVSNDVELKIGFIGAGNMAFGIAKGLLPGKVPPANVKVSAPSSRNLERFQELGVAVTHSNVEVVSGSDVVFVAVKPHLVPLVLAETSQTHALMGISRYAFTRPNIRVRKGLPQV